MVNLNLAHHWFIGYNLDYTIRPTDLQQLEYPCTDRSSRLIVEAFAGITYSFTVFIIAIAGGPVPLLFPFSVLAAITTLIWGWGKFKRLPVLTFFLVGYALVALIFTGWGI